MPRFRQTCCLTAQLLSLHGVSAACASAARKAVLQLWCCCLGRAAAVPCLRCYALSTMPVVEQGADSGAAAVLVS